MQQAQTRAIILYRTFGPDWSAEEEGQQMKQRKADRRSQRTYRLVSVALAELMLEKPYDEILVQDILDRAGIGRTTFYAHYFDKADVLDNMIAQLLETYTEQIAHRDAPERIVPSLELFRHIYERHQHQQLQAIMRGHAGEQLWEAMQTALCNAIEPALVGHCANDGPLSIPLPVVSQYLAGAFLTLLKWWLSADMPYPPEHIESIFQQLAMPGAWAILQGKQTRTVSI
jgi:AcrR family transcriptional regulator